MTLPLEILYENDHLAEVDPAERRLALRSLLARDLPDDEVSVALKRVTDAIDGYGPLTDLLCDETITDVLVNGPDEVWVDGAAGPTLTPITFSGDEELRSLVDRLLARAGARADASHPVVDAAMPDGTRINVVLPPISRSGICMSIRRFRTEPFSLNDLVAIEMLDAPHAERLRRAVAAKETIAISGGTGCGKTTLLNALLNLVGRDERVVTIEETPELRPLCEHSVSLVAREANVEGRGRLSPDDLVRAALRMRPDRIVVGEVRGPEARAAISAMSVGHSGSMVTLHARSSAEVVPRLVTLILQASPAVSADALSRQVLGCFDLFVHLAREGPQRRLVEMTSQSVVAMRSAS